MSDFDNNNSFSRTVNASDLFEAYLGTKDKITKKWTKEPPQRYTGDIFHGNIHKHGFYFIDKEDKLFYDGLFYSNKLEGYAQIFYNDGSNFQGLFKGNRRFGPGVLTYANGEQDVGLWSGQSLIRLGVVNAENSLPKMGTTTAGQLKLLKFRYLVPISHHHQNVAYDVLKRLGANEKVLQQSCELYNLNIQNKRNMFFNRGVYDKQYFIDQDPSYIDIILIDEPVESESDLPEEEAAGASFDINVERIRQISEELEIIERELHEVKTRRLILDKQVHYCRTCCYDRDVEERSSHLEETKNFVSFEQDSIIPRVSTDTRPFTISACLEPTPPPGPDVQASDIESSYSYYSYVPPNADDNDAISGLEFRSNSGELDDSDLHNEVQNYLMGICQCDEAMQIEDLYVLEKKLGAIKRDELFFECIRKNLRKKLGMHLLKSDSQNKVKTTKMLVDEVLAWNNEKYCIRMLKHSFMHKSSEYMVTFKVSDILAGKRQEFAIPGPHERNCTDFLDACSKGDVDTIFMHINKNEVNVNVCDAKGNSGVFFAAINKQIQTLEILVSLGAKLDQVNDEGLLPLSMCFLVCLADNFKVTDWENAFLPDFVPIAAQEEAFKWYPRDSLLDLLTRHKIKKEASVPELVFSHSKIYSGEILNKQFSHSKIYSNEILNKQPYLFDTSYVTSVNEQPIEKMENKPQAVVERSKSVVILPKEESLIIVEQTIVDVIRTLLNFGADPNAGGAPMPVLFLSIYTEIPNLVEGVLAADADVHTSLEDDMTALHIIASSKCIQANVDICSLLIAYDCDPRLKTTPNHWQEQKPNIIGIDINPDEIPDMGKNPLHILCMRKDHSSDNCSFFQQMTGIFVESRVDMNAKYLGHTPLSLAVLMGNLKLVDALMEYPIVNPYQTLDYNMGNVLTVYILKRYQHLLPPNAKEILISLVDVGVNPLKSIGEYENVIAFMEKEHEQLPKSKNGKKKQKKESLPEPPKKAGKKADKSRKNSQKEIMEYIIELTRSAIIRYIQMVAVENLYNLIEENLSEHACVATLAQFLTADIFISNLQKLFKYGKIKSERFDKSICLEAIDIIVAQLKVLKSMKSLKTIGTKSKSILPDQKTADVGKSTTSLSKTRSKSRSRKLLIKSPDYDHIIETTDFKKIPKLNIKLDLLPPGLDGTSKYKVCFQCLKRRNKTLLACPKCQLIYFCSESCNISNLKLKTLHTCNIVFYDSESTKMESPDGEDVREILSELYARIRENCDQRCIKKIEEKNEQIRKLFEEEMKLDIYGTKTLKKAKQSTLATKTPTVISLCGSISQLSQIVKSELADIRRKQMYGSLSTARRSSSIKFLKKSTSEERYSCMLNKKHDSSLIEFNTALDKKETDKEKCGKSCLCDECTHVIKESTRKCKKIDDKIPDFKNIVKGESRFKIGRFTDKELIIKKLRMIPDRYREFIGLMTRYFPDVDFSSLLLPYACYSNGHLYYKFLDEDYYTRSYSMV